MRRNERNKVESWLSRLLERRNVNVAAVALANKNARIVWALLARDRNERPVLHGDNGATLKATTVLAMLWWLGVKPSYSRPRVSDDNAFVESLFRTAKYRPEFPAAGFADLGAAREWAREFVHWYNHDHRHSGYDAIVCDEGQDFREEFWVPLELLLTDYDSSPLYVFYDDNQNLYARAGTFPIRDEPFSLTTNCRNTAPIHEAAYKHYKGVPVSPPDIQG